MTSISSPSLAMPAIQQALAEEPHIIRSLYAALTEKEGFHAFLDLLRQAINACAAELVVVRKKPLQLDHIWYAGLSQEFMEWYTANNMIEHDLVVNHATYASLGVFQTALSLIDQVKNQPDYDRWQQDQNMVDSAWLVVDATETHTTILAMQRTIEQGAYQADEMAKLNRLVPYIRQAVQLYQQLDKTITTSQSLAALVNALPKPSFVLNEQAEIRFANARAEQFLKQEKRLKVKNQRLQFNEREHQDAFLRSSTQIIRASMGMDGFDSDVVILKRDDAANLMMTLTPIEGGEQAFSGVLVTVYDGKQRQLPSAAMIASYFALSASESQLCADLLQGWSLKEIAAQRHKSEATLRSYLKQIFLKTGVNRQSQLICALLSALMR